MNRRRAFTLVEILAVIAIISLLLGLLLPALASVRATARATASLSNLRQWGLGTMNFCTMNKDTLPWEGFKDAVQMPLNFQEKTWWANAVPPFVGQKPYHEVSEWAQDNGQPIPLPGNDQEGSIFIDPSAQTPAVAPHMGGVGGNAVPFFFCYVPNSQLNNTWQNHPEWGTQDPYARMRLSFISQPDVTVLMLEMRTVKNELSATDPFYNKNLNTHRSDWKRFAARHFNGGHMLFADGHAGWIDNEFATTNAQGTRDESEPNGDWNKPELIWDPRGPATDE